MSDLISTKGQRDLLRNDSTYLKENLSETLVITLVKDIDWLVEFIEEKLTDND